MSINLDKRDFANLLINSFGKEILPLTKNTVENCNCKSQFYSFLKNDLNNNILCGRIFELLYILKFVYCFIHTNSLLNS